MSRPYLNINSATYSYTTDVVTLDITALRLRGQSTITLGGFTSSQTISLSDGYYNNSSYTFSAVLDASTSSTTTTTTYNASTATIVFSGTASKNANVGFKIPQIGWNNITHLKSFLFNGVPENAYMYFVHSYFVENCENAIAKTDYVIEYSSAIHKNNFSAVQFHPEKSGELGQKILENFIFGQ